MKIYHAELYRFGGSIIALDESEEKAIKKVMTEYTRRYKDRNGTSPKRDKKYDDLSYYDDAKEDIEIMELDTEKAIFY